MACYRTVDGVDLRGKRAVVRADLNVPLKDGQVADATRIERIVPTLKALLDGGASVVLLSHLGRPQGVVNPEFSLRPLVAEMTRLLGRSVTFIATDWRDGGAAAEAAKLQPGEIALAENIRYHPGEEANDAAFAKGLAALGDIFVNDAFSAAHRAHASTEAIAHLLPAYAGHAMAAELSALEAALANPVHPVVAIVGGSKVSTKIAVLENLVSIVDHLVIGGGMANTFLAARGGDVGASLCEHDLKETAMAIEIAAKASNCEIILPVDAVVAEALAENSPTEIVTIDAVAGAQMILDIGPRSIALVIACLNGAKTLLWNGPLGAFEIAPFDRGTVRVAQHAAELTTSGALVSVAGGGDTVAALNAASATNQFTYVSTAGGAFLEWLEGKTLPSVAALQRT